MSGTPTPTAVGALTINTSAPDIEAIFQSAAASIATIPASNQFTYNGNILPQGDGKSVLLIPASVVGNVTIPVGYAYVVVAQGSNASLVSAQDYTSFPDPVVIGDGFNFSGHASIVANGGGQSNITDTHSPYDGHGSAIIHVAGTGSITGGVYASIIVDAGANATVNSSANFAAASGNVVVNGGATAHVFKEYGGLTLQTGAKTTVSLRELGGVNVNIGINLGTTPTVPLAPPTVPGSSNARSNAAQQSTPTFTNNIAVAGAPDIYYVSHQREPSTANTFMVSDASSVNLIAIGVNDKVTVSAGASTIFGLSGNLIDASKSATGVFFVGGADTVVAKSLDTLAANTPSNASTVIGGAGNVTMFATAGDVLELGTGQANVFVGGTAASTIYANGSGGGGSFFGGVHGDEYHAGNYTNQTFVGEGGNDTIYASGQQGLVTAPLIYAENGEHLLLVGNAATTVVGSTHDGVISDANTTGNNVLFSGFGLSGNQTLIGSGTSYDSSGTATHDTFVEGANNTGAFSRLLIDNWHPGDVFFLTGGYLQNDSSIMDNAISNSLANGSKGDLSFTLSDNTTVSFIGSHPTNFSGAASF